MSVDLTIPGDHAGIRRLADWLAPDVDEAMSEAWFELNYIGMDSQHYWRGESGEAFRGAARQINLRSTPVSAYLKRAADVFTAYANRLERGQEDFDDLFEQAGRAGLTRVTRTRIVLPPMTTLDYCPAEGSPDEDVEEWNRYVERLEAYSAISTEVGTWWGELEAWIYEHMLPLVEQVEEFHPLNDTFDALVLGEEDLVSTTLTAADVRTQRDLTAWNEIFAKMQSDADRHTAGLRSGNPALKAAAEAANPRALRRGVRDLAETLGEVSRAGRVIPGIGIVLEVVSGVHDIAEGDSASGIAAEFLGGLGGGAAGAAGGTALAAALGSNPLGWAIGGAIVVGVGGSYLARWAWEAALPLHVRETIDDFFTGNPPVLVNEATGTWAVGTR